MRAIMQWQLPLRKPFRRTFHYKIHSGFDRINAHATREVAKNCFFAGLDFTRP